MKALLYLAFAILFVATISLVACAKSAQSQGPNYTVSFGEGGDNYASGCAANGDYEAFQTLTPTESDGIFEVVLAPAPDFIPVSSPTPFDPNKWAEQSDSSQVEPAQGASLSGNFDGFGKRSIEDVSANKTYTVDVVYHASTYDAVVTRMEQLGCFK